MSEITSIPSASWRMLDQRFLRRPLARGLDAAWDAGMRLADKMVPRRRAIFRSVEKILALEPFFGTLTDSQLKKTAEGLRWAFRRGRETPGDIERSLALVREVAHRQIGQKPFPVQIAGALTLERGLVAEMATGEGKTLTSALAVTLAGWRGRGCHVVTVNDYLARRDAEWMEPIYRFCGVSVAFLEQETPTALRRAAYAADVTYLTNKEVAADFLRDRLVIGRMQGLSDALIAKIAGAGRDFMDRLVQRGMACAIVDEADSILIDEAVTPLIISGQAPNEEQVECFRQAAGAAGQLQEDVDYRIDHRYRDIELTERGRSQVQELTRDLGGVWKGPRRGQELINQALVAKELYHRDKQYVIEEGKVVIIDDFTGRLMPDRSWRDGMHQAVEAKEGIKVNPPKDTYARISFQRFFRLYRKLSGMTGTASESSAEFWQIYHLPVVVIPTHRPCQRRQMPDIVVATQEAKWRRIVEEVKRLHATGSPVLVGTRSVQASEHLSALLKAEGLEHQVLNAVHHREEAQIVAGAGGAGKITVATNMAGRGTDIKLGRGVCDLGGLHVIAGEPNDSARIDRQLYGRGARQGDPGSAQGIFSLEDDVLIRYTKAPAAYFRRRHSKSEGEITSSAARWLFRLAQWRAELHARRQRAGVLRTDHWLDEQLGFAGYE
jgi:preprotein translocase subunit SecA